MDARLALLRRAPRCLVVTPSGQAAARRCRRARARAACCFAPASSCGVSWGPTCWVGCGRAGDDATRAYALRTRAPPLASRTAPAGVASHEAALTLHGMPASVDDPPCGSSTSSADATRARRPIGGGPHPPAKRGTLEARRRLWSPHSLAIVRRRRPRCSCRPRDSGLRTRCPFYWGAVTWNDASSLTRWPRCLPPGWRRPGSAAASPPSSWLRADPGAKSVGETRTRVLSLVIPGFTVRSQVEIRDDGGGARGQGSISLSVTWLLSSSDGAVKYQGPGGRAALAAEKRREDRLRALGYAVVRVTLGRPRPTSKGRCADPSGCGGAEYAPWTP